MRDKRFCTGDLVAFRLADAMCPEFERIVAQIGPDLMMSGEVVMLSDRGGRKEHFAIVNVTGINAPLIVPMQKLSDGAITGADVVRGH